MNIKERCEQIISESKQCDSVHIVSKGAHIFGDVLEKSTSEFPRMVVRLDDHMVGFIKITEDSVYEVLGKVFTLYL